MDVKKNFDKKTLVALGAGLGAAIVATLLFIMIDSFKEPEPKAEKTVEVRVLKAIKDIPKGVNVTPEMMTYTSVPANNARIDMIADPDQISNLKTAKEIKAEALLSKSDFLSIAPSTIPEGFVAMSLEINTVSGVTWMLKEGDVVDIIGVLRPTEPGDKRGNVSKVQLQAIRVLAVDAPAPKKDKQIGTSEKGTITLLMTPEQAQKLMLVSTVGEYSLALRGSGDTAEHPINAISVPEVIDTPKTVVKKAASPQRIVVRSQLTVVEVK